MPLEHAHRLGEFDPGHCRDCARDTGLLDHYWHVQRQERAFRNAESRVMYARRLAVRALWLSGVGILVAVIALCVALRIALVAD